MKVRVCLDNERFQDKNAAKRAIKEINNRIVNRIAGRLWQAV